MEAALAVSQNFGLTTHDIDFNTIMNLKADLRLLQQKKRSVLQR